MAPRSGTLNHASPAPARDDFHAFAHPQPGCILVVDDDPDVRDMMDAVLTTAGYVVITAVNGEEALEFLDSIRPALILLDVNMPMMDGAEFREAQRRDPELIRIPTVVMTGGADVEPQLDIAVEETLRKPVHRSDLLAMVQRYCIPSPR
jgi:CheY-like chemotaxis protein